MPHSERPDAAHRGPGHRTDPRAQIRASRQVQPLYTLRIPKEPPRRNPPWQSPSPCTPARATHSRRLPIRLKAWCTEFESAFRASDGQMWTAGTDTMAPSMDSAEDFCDALNLTLGLDREGSTASSIESSPPIPTANAIPNAPPPRFRNRARYRLKPLSRLLHSRVRSGSRYPPEGLSSPAPPVQSSLAAFRPLRLDRFERRDPLVGDRIEPLQERRIAIVGELGPVARAGATGGACAAAPAPRAGRRTPRSANS